ncbi:Menaquinone biosynthesis protein MenD [Parasponia andersonii]|uniref:Menaquinone biosynthesis protein MenD n=1 Tax=Parasponia andersonii TaxID=3476 RepID=A0A2P5DMV1_PARAD|nr:Menaquinone biosynthesis protein MenD [Parasponia andersonii]
MSLKPHTLLRKTTTPFLRERESHSGRSFPCRTPLPSSSPPLSFLHRSSLRLPRNPHSKVVQGLRFDGPVMEISEISGMEDGDFEMETCIIRTLPPAITLEQGIERIKEAMENLKLNPHSFTSTGFFRFQVAVPPSAKALNWFCIQPESSSVFPLFFISKDKNEPSYKSLVLNETRGVFGMGSAVYFKRNRYGALGERTMPKRYFSNDSTPIMAYGFVDIDFNKELTVMEHQAGSYYFVIPQIELNECEGVSILSATLVWCDSFPYTFEEAIHSFELSLVQACTHFWSTTDKCFTRNVLSTLRKLNVIEDRIISTVYMNALSTGGKFVVVDIKELKEAPSSRQFCIRLSASIVVASNMLDQNGGVGYSAQDCANINTVWASLIIEECSRLGLTYFCVAPGSRSSPLAIAASTHPCITCNVCYDERSLAFHAVGYARGSRKPAVVITSSGTAVSNLLPAVVEASQDFVPLLLLTADRPPELQDTGANQSINQVKHFGSFVRFFFSLPAPTDCIPARMVLTTVDSAVHWATSSPCGPVHINCPFREPLDNSPSKWMSSCLKGLDFWMCSAEPFTKYFNVECAHACNLGPHEMSEVLNVIQNVKKGILIIGGIHTVDEMWAVLLLAKHLLWPVVADILSGLRLRKLLTSFPEIEHNILFIDYLDHSLLSDVVSDWMNVDVIIQIGSRIISKRVSKMLEACSPCSYIMVDNHPFRYDPSHIVTLRIESSIVKFANYLMQVDFLQERKGWSAYLRAVNLMVARELSFQVSAEYSLTEPQVAQLISEAISSDTALFIGNSMGIRDADMYGHGWSSCSDSTSAMVLNLEALCQLVWVVGNRGASGIDGLVSTAVGFAVGCNKRVLCVIGDVSFLHDTNGLALLNQRTSRKPMTVLVNNNRGGAIFSLLPIAERTEERILTRFFYTSHNISIRGLCMAHGVKHVGVQTKAELRDALFRSQYEEMDCVIEVASSIDANANFHSTLRKFACQAADGALRFLLRLPVQESVSDVFFRCKVHSIKYSLFRVPLCAPPTVTTFVYNNTSFYRDGFILSLSLEDGSVGFGEVSPLNIKEENLLDVEEQLRFLLHEIKGAEINCFLPLLRGSFSSWIWTNLGIPPSSLFPSVRCGLEMAILNALAARQGYDLLSLLHVQKDEVIAKESSKVQICGLVDSNGTPTEVADIVAKLVEEGFAAIKLKVARRRSPTQDARVIQEVRKKIGYQVELRADANRNWTYKEAIEFGSLVKDCDLQYIEEPVNNEVDVIRFCEESGIPVALDETIDYIQENPLDILMKYTHPGIVAIVIKPSVVGGFENSALLAQWAQQHGKMAVVSAAYESGLGLSAYIHLSCYLELKNVEISKLMNKKTALSVAHGLGTYRWLKEDVATNPLKISRNAHSGFIEASIADANQLLHSFQINHHIVHKDHKGDEIRTYQLPLDFNGISYCIKVQEIGEISHDSIIIFLHGFLGTSEDWIAIMKAVSKGSRCISIDLPGHGGTHIQYHGDKEAIPETTWSIEVFADIVHKVIHYITPVKVTVVGYSMGARIALYMALRFNDKLNGAVVISGSPGIKDEVVRKIRRAIDDSRAQFLVSYGLDIFLDTWYGGRVWNSLRAHPKFNQILGSRRNHHEDMPSLAKVLSDSSIGRQLPLWDDLNCCKTPLLIIVGEKDEKFKRIAQDMCYAIDGSRKTGEGPPNDIYEMVQISKCGHAVHLENPLPVISALRRFLTRLKPGRLSAD